MLRSRTLRPSIADLAPASVNNILTLLSTVLKAAVEGGVIGAVPRIRKSKKSPQCCSCYEELRRRDRG